MTIEGHATVLLVGDVGRPADYYRDQLGFEVDRYAKLPRALRIRAPGWM